MVKGFLLRQETISQKRVIEFLESIARNSTRSRDTYLIGLSHFQTFLHGHNANGYTLENIIDKLTDNEFDVYALLNQFVSYLISVAKLSPATITLHVAAVRSYLQYYDIDISPTKFKRRVKIPKNYREDEEPIDASDIRKILLSCQNRRLKPYLLLLATCGCRTLEGLATRCKDIDFSVSPTRIHIRKEYAKTRVGRDVYISDEATKFLKEWLEWKYRKRNYKKQAFPNPVMMPDDLVFSKAKFGKGPGEGNNKNMQANPQRIYQKITQEFNTLLKIVQMDERKEGMSRRKVTLHSIRRFVKTVVSTQVNQDYSEWFLGHSKSSYWTMKEPQRREIYATKVMKYLTFLDYSGLEVSGKNVEAKLEEKDREIAFLKQRYNESVQSVSLLSDEFALQSERLNKLERIMMMQSQMKDKNRK